MCGYRAPTTHKKGRTVLTEIATQMFKTDIVDPTSDSILTRVVNYGISAMMVLVVILGAWYAFKAWMTNSGGPGAAGKTGGEGGKSAGWSHLRNIAFGIIIIEAILGGVLTLANYGTGILPSLGFG